MNQMPKLGRVLILLSSVALAAAFIAYAARRDSAASAGPAPADAQIHVKPVAAPVPAARPSPVPDDGSAIRPVPPHPPAPETPPAAEEPKYFGGSKSMTMPRRHNPSK
jgi:hypothetical protein